MAVWSEVNVFDTVKSNRFDAERFKPDYISNEKILLKLKCTNLKYFIKEITGGATPLGAKYLGKGIPFIRVQNIRENRFDSTDIVYIEPSIHQNQLKRSAIKDQDVLLTITGVSYGNSTVAYSELLPANMNQHSVRIQLRNNLQPEFLSTFFISKYGRLQSDSKITGNTRPALTYPEIDKYIIPVIEEQEQKKVALLVKNSLKKQQLSQSLYTRAQELLERELGLDKLVFEKPLSYEARLSEVVGNNRADAEFYQPMYLKLRTLVRNYKHGFSKLTDIAFSLPPNVDPGKFANTEFEYVELSSINTTLGIIGKGTKLLGKEAPSRARRKLETGDILASAVVGSVDKAAIVDSSSNDKLASTGFFQFRPKQIKSEYLLILVRSKLITMQLHQEATGGILSAVPDNRLHNVIIPTLPDDLQCEISDLVYKSHKLFHKSQQLLEQAKQRVEELIEQAVQK